MHRSLKTHYIMSKKSSLPFYTDEEALKPIVNDPVKFSLFLVKLQNEYSHLYLRLIKALEDDNVTEVQKDNIRQALPLLSPFFLIGRSFQELFKLKDDDTALNDYEGLVDAFRFYEEYINNKFRELCQVSEHSQQEQH